MQDDFLKITSTIYKVLDFFPSDDPLKNKAKEKVLAILENITLISNTKGWVSLKKEKASAQVIDDINILETYLTLGKYQGWIDTINFLILTKEYNKIKEKINPPKGSIKNNLEIISNIKEPLPRMIEEKNTPIGSYPEKLIVQDSRENIMKKDKKFSYKNSNRQLNILNILENKGRVQVSDIIKEIPNITKRTIRRDLGNLLKNGEIIRVGEFNQVFYEKVVRTSKLS